MYAGGGNRASSSHPVFFFEAREIRSTSPALDLKMSMLTRANMNTKVLLGILGALIAGYLAWRWIAPAPAPPAVAHAPAQRSSPRPIAAARSTPSKKPGAQQPAAKSTPAHPVAAKQSRLAPEGTYF